MPRPVKDRQVGGIMAGCAFHQRQCAAHVVLHPPQLIPVFGPCNHVAMAADGLQPVGVRHVQVFVQPFLVYLVAPAVA